MALGIALLARQVLGNRRLFMPLPVFLTLILSVIAAAGLTVTLATQAGFPLALLSLSALAAALLMRRSLWR